MSKKIFNLIFIYFLFLSLKSYANCGDPRYGVFTCDADQITLFFGQNEILSNKYYTTSVVRYNTYSEIFGLTHTGTIPRTVMTSFKSPTLNLDSALFRSKFVSVVYPLQNNILKSNPPRWNLGYKAFISMPPPKIGEKAFTLVLRAKNEQDQVVILDKKDVILESENASTFFLNNSVFNNNNEILLGAHVFGSYSDFILSVENIHADIFGVNHVFFLRKDARLYPNHFFISNSQGIKMNIIGYK